MERVKTGIDGLDSMLNGGVPARRHVLLCGGPGCGKTTIGMQYLYHGAKNGENGAFITLEEPAEKILENMKASYTGWTDIDRVIGEKKLEVVKIHPMSSKNPGDSFSNFVDVLQAYITQHNAKRVVVDSATILEMIFEDQGQFRKSMFSLLEMLNNLDSNVIFTVEADSTTREGQKYTLEQFIADGVIALYNLPMKEKRINAIEVLKMRGTSHSKSVCPIAFTPNGVVVYPNQKIY
jgi:circadian clock protein KaiC